MDWKRICEKKTFAGYWSNELKTAIQCLKYVRISKRESWRLRKPYFTARKRYKNESKFPISTFCIGGLIELLSIFQKSNIFYRKVISRVSSAVSLQSSKTSTSSKVSEASHFSTTSLNMQEKAGSRWGTVRWVWFTVSDYYSFSIKNKT